MNLVPAELQNKTDVQKKTGRNPIANRNELIIKESPQ